MVGVGIRGDLVSAASFDLDDMSRFSASHDIFDPSPLHSPALKSPDSKQSAPPLKLTQFGASVKNELNTSRSSASSQSLQLTRQSSFESRNRKQSASSASNSTKLRKLSNVSASGQSSTPNTSRKSEGIIQREVGRIVFDIVIERHRITTAHIFSLFFYARIQSRRKWALQHS